MTMIFEEKCVCQLYLDFFKRIPFCPFCKGTGIRKSSLYLHDTNIKPDFKEIEGDIEDEDLYAHFKCQCGEDVYFPMEVPSALVVEFIGFLLEIKMDDTHVGDNEFWDREIKHTIAEREKIFLNKNTIDANK